MNIISFNVGIELGQIAALSLMLLVIAVFRKSRSFPIFSKVSNYFLILAGAYLFLMQAHGYQHTAHPEEFAVSEKSAERMAENKEAAQQPKWQDTIIVTIPAGSDIEYKLQLAKGASLKYLWQTDQGDLFFDFHGEPEGDTTGYFKSYQKNTKPHSSGSLTTEFAGTHGWYWKNSNSFPVTITLNIDGQYQRLDLGANSQESSSAKTVKSGSRMKVD